ncbi:hypothetical protein [Pseudomonas syringae]|uniref:hypothetical protein n=1 Tax=Pseudomonas syringae TaxID=317 RepID=UPI0015C45493|nr:hypothetical protein [Pseudomonas syringae]
MATFTAKAAISTDSCCQAQVTEKALWLFGDDDSVTRSVRVPFEVVAEGYLFQKGFS